VANIFISFVEAKVAEGVMCKSEDFFSHVGMCRYNESVHPRNQSPSFTVSSGMPREAEISFLHHGSF
jgi:hypothetical protein